MNSKAILRAHVCLTTATTAVFAGGACASASQTHTLKHGETVEFLSRHYHVALADILAANHMRENDILNDGRKLYIPDATHRTIVPSTMHRQGRINGEHVSVRIGPAAVRHRLEICDNGAHVTVTARHEGWLQVKLGDGRSGWVRPEFVTYTGHGESSSPARKTQKSNKESVAAANANKRNRARQHHAEENARKEQGEHHRLKEAAARLRARHNEEAAGRLASHEAKIARARHERHLAEAAAARRHSHIAEIAAHRHAEELAAHLHRKHLLEIAARHHSHLKAIAEAAHHKHANATAQEQHREHLKAITEAKRHRHGKELAEATHQKHLKEIAEANHRRRLKEIAEAKHHGENAPAARALHNKHLAEIAEAQHRKHLKEIAEKRSRHHDQELAHERRQRHLDEIAAARHRHHLEAIANAQRRHLAAVAQHQHNLEAAALRHQESGHYSHNIRPEAESPTASNDVVRSAYAYRGTPYRWGESRPGGFDCSGFTKYIYGRKGVSLPRTAAEQFHAGNAVGHRSLKPGDLVFFHTTRRGISHVGMYVGSGKFVHSSSKKSGGVRVDNLDSGYYNTAFRGARRVRKEASEPSGE